MNRIDTPIRAQDAKAGPEALFGMRPAGQHGDDQPFGARSDFAGPSAEPIRRPLGVTPMRVGHVIRGRAVLAAEVAPLMSADALAAVENLDGAGGNPHVDL